MLLIELKKMFYKKSLLLISLLGPLIIIAIFGSIILPSIFHVEQLGIINNVYNEDTSPDLAIFINSYVSKSTGKNSPNILKVRKIDSFDEGFAAISKNNANMFTHIPPHTVDNILDDKKMDINIYTKLEYAFESTIYINDLQQNISLAEKISPAYEILAQLMYDKGIPIEEIIDDIEESQALCSLKFVFRKSMFDHISVALKRNIVPFTYYLLSILTILISLATLPIVWLTSTDINSVMMKRSAFKGDLKIKYMAAKILASSLFISFTIILIIPVNNYIQKSLLKNLQILQNPLLIIIGVAISALFLASFSIFIATFIPNGTHGIWLAFYIIVLMSFISGVLLPIEMLPQALKIVGRLMPIYHIKELMGSIFSVYSPIIFTRSLLILFIYSFLFFGLSFLLIDKRRIYR